MLSSTSRRHLFDTVFNQILPTELSHYGIRRVADKWFDPYLTMASQWLPITCGVPQGSILGSLIFLLYINDMNQCVESLTIYHFADDTNLLYSCKPQKV